MPPELSLHAIVVADLPLIQVYRLQRATMSDCNQRLEMLGGETAVHRDIRLDTAALRPAAFPANPGRCGGRTALHDFL
jgi:hypothetical protein